MPWGKGRPESDRQLAEDAGEVLFGLEQGLQKQGLGFRAAVLMQGAVGPWA